MHAEWKASDFVVNRNNFDKCAVLIEMTLTNFLVACLWCDML